MQFIEGGIKNESGPNDEGSDDRNESEVNGTNVSGLDSLHLAEQGVFHEDPALNSKKEVQMRRVNRTLKQAEVVNLTGIMLVTRYYSGNYPYPFAQDDDETVNENDAELVKQIEKQRRRAVAAVCGGRKSLASRNSYKESLM
ncbi:hypothetical protein CISIN_1g042394mg [Citrus sinensis]|uniref:Uncharacterized protein n=1 Tax=Citrus sinensis TaxID=2711 RepID=A0A067E7C8_CITSI|nr:hypothetical protein CISIN_1g042394mg [Citrus sinensis]